MSVKFSTTTADYLEWNQSMNLIRNLYNDTDFKISLLVSFGSFWGLRISDILSLKWEQVYNLDEYIFTSQKGSVYSNQRINVILKDLKVRYNLKIKNFSSHSLRKAFGREIFNRSAENA